MEPAEQVMIAREVAAVEQRNGELGITGVEAIALAQHSRRGAQLPAQVPHFLREAADGIFENLLGLAVPEEKKQIDIGMREQPAPAKSSGSHQRKVGGLS